MKTNNELGKIKAEMMNRRRELIEKQKKLGGCVSIRLESDKIDFCYNPDRKQTKTNPMGEKFFITGTMNGCPIIVNEFEVYQNN
jgi:hypothetical protein